MPDQPPPSESDAASARAERHAAARARQLRDYWRKNIILLAALLTVWFLVSFGCGILWVDELDNYRLPGTGFPLGFWFAQQGSIYVFVALIAIYVVAMNRLDRSHHVHE